MSGGDEQRLPSGVVTFLFTDVEGSTQLWAADSTAMGESLRVHDAIVRSAVEARGGFVFTTAGDSFAVAFAQASAAVDAAAGIQSTLAQAEWPGPSLRVRIGLHLGEAEERGGDYFGPVVNACARVEAAGHGGQVLITDAVRSVIDRDDLSDLGAHQLRDLPQPLQLFQVGGGDFGTLRGLVGARDSLPTRRTRLLGRDPAIAELRPLLLTERLVTLVGPGGIGKTSLAVETAGQLSGEFSGGVHFADLAPVSNPDDIIAAICRGVQLTVTNSPYEQLTRFLSETESLIIVDNCEHLIDDVAEIIDHLLGDVPTLRLLATSREHLDLDGERVVRVEPLPSDVGSAAVRLFVERVVATSPEFDPTDANLERISAICARLDGLPLAIELAAGRARSMSVAEIETGLADRFALLAGGRRGKLRRQQTIRATIDWSIELLESVECMALARLAVFAGPFSLAGAAAVAEQTVVATSDMLSSLTAKSLVQRGADVDGEARFHLLETIREWGFEEMVRQGVLGDVRDLHARWHLSVAESLTAMEFIAFRGEGEAAKVDAVAAAAHLGETDPESAAILLGMHMRGMVETGSAAMTQGFQRAARSAGWTRFPCRQWLAEHVVRMDLMDGLPFDDPPPFDDGSFEWRFIVGGAEHDNAGMAGWYRTWLSPGRVVNETRELSPIGADPEARLIRAFGLANAVLAFTHLGYFEEAIESFEESSRLFDIAWRGRATTWVEIFSLATSAMYLGVDLSETAAAAELGRRPGHTVLDRLGEALVLTAPDDRRLAVAQTARDHCLGRYPAEESAFLAVLGFYALADGDNDRARLLSETIVLRTPATLTLKRHNLIRARGGSLDLIADQRHHQQALAAELDIVGVSDLNRRKLHDELTRLLG
jgi:predicted ATPase/class 3 adenylate cyclase